MFSINKLFNSSEKYRAFLLSVLDNLPQCSENKRIYTGGTIDSNQTEFEKMSLKGRIGVIAYSKEAGNALLMFLRMIYDDNNDFFLNNIAGDFDDEFSMADAIKICVKDEEGCNDEHSFTEKSVIHLQGGKEIIVDRTNMDLWDLQRIRDFVSDEF